MLFLLPLGSGMEELVQHQPRFPRLQEKKALLASNLVWHSKEQLPRRLDSVPSYTFYPTSYHSESHSITLVVLLVELKDWISLSVPTRHPCLRVIQYQWGSLLIRKLLLGKFLTKPLSYLVGSIPV